MDETAIGLLDYLNQVPLLAIVLGALHFMMRRQNDREDEIDSRWEERHKKEISRLDALRTQERTDFLTAMTTQRQQFTTALESATNTTSRSIDKLTERLESSLRSGAMANSHATDGD